MGMRIIIAAAAGLLWSASLGWAQSLTADEKAVQTVIDSQITAFRGGKHETAFGFAAPSLQQIFGSTDRFIGMVKRGYGPIYGAKQWSFGRSRAQDDIILQEVLLTGPKGGNWIALYTLRKQDDGSWRIAAVQMKQAASRST